jgi:Mg2+ and Co2+ transporter CorA
MNEPAKEKKTDAHGDEEKKKPTRAAKMLRKVGKLSSRSLSPVRNIASKSKWLPIPPKNKPDDDDTQRHSLAFEDVLESAQIDKERLNELCQELDLMNSNYDGLNIVDEDADDDDNEWR